MIKNFLSLLLTVLVLSFSSCDLVNELVPDVDTDFTKTLQIQIQANSGETGDQVIDVTSSEEYNNFKSNIEGFELRKVTYEIKNVNAPDDMYFNGTVICSNEEKTEEYIVGSWEKANLSELGAAGSENDITQASENIDIVFGWLNSPGRFKMKAIYNIINADGSPYGINIQNKGSNFEMVIKFYVTVKTKV